MGQDHTSFWRVYDKCEGVCKPGQVLQHGADAGRTPRRRYDIEKVGRTNFARGLPRPRAARTPLHMLHLEGKHAAIFGAASESSIAWAIAQALQRYKCRISLGYQQRFRSRVLQLVRAGETPVAYYERCDVTKSDELKTFFAGVDTPIDVLVHSIAYANPETFGKPLSAVSQAEFTEALVASSYSLIPLVEAAADKLAPGASILAMTYLGGQRVVANYKLMGVAKAALEATVRQLADDLGPQGIRVNAISAGPIKTLAASQIGAFDSMLQTYEQVAPLRRAIKAEDVGNLAAFLASDLARNITGQTIFVDAGYNILAMAALG